MNTRIIVALTLMVLIGLTCGVSAIEYAQITMYIDSNPAQTYACVFDHDYTNPDWTVVDALAASKANVKHIIIYTKELYPKPIADYISAQFAEHAGIEWP